MENRKNFLKKISLNVRAGMWYMICAFMQKGISVLTTPIFTRLMSTDEYGNYNIFNAWYGIITVFISLELSKSVYEQGLIKYERTRNVFISSLQGLTLSLITMWTIIYMLANEFWNKIFGLTTVQMLSLLLMVWTTAVFRFWAAEQRVVLKYRWLCILTLIVSVAKPAVGIVMVYFADDKVTARILGLVIVEMAGYSWLFVYQMIRGKVFFSGKIWLYALKLGFPLIPHYLSQNILESSDRIMIKMYIGPDDAGLYSLAGSVSSLMLLFNTALMQTLSPWIYKKIKDNKIEMIPPVEYPLMIVIAVLNLLLILAAPDAIKLFAPASYYDARWVIPPLAMSVFYIFIFELFVRFEFYYEKTILITVGTSLSAALNIFMNFFAIRKFGYYAAGYTTLICYMVYAASHYVFMNRLIKQHKNCASIYCTKKIILISSFFLAAGIIAGLSYFNNKARYFLLAFIIICLAANYKKILSLVYRVLLLKKNTENGDDT